MNESPTTDRAAPDQSERLHRLELDFRAILDNMPAMIGYWDRNLRNRFGNRAYLEWFGIDSDSMPGMHIREVIGEERYQLNLPYMEKALAGERQSFERAIPTPDGKSVRHSMAEYIPDIRDGEVQGFFVLVSDVTQLKDAERKLHESEKFWRTLVEAEPEWVGIVNAAGAIVQINPAGLRLIEADCAEQVIGAPMTEFLCPGERDAFREMHRTVLAGESVKTEFEVRGLKGTHRWISVLAVPMEFMDEMANLSVIRDITERKRLEMELQRSNADLDHFASVASHDLRHPLRMISSYLTILGRSASSRLNAEERGFLGFAVSGAKRMDRMITDLLEYSRILQNTATSEPVPLAVIAANALANLAGTVAEAGAEINLPPALPVVSGIGTELERLFQNLIGNAIKFTAPGRKPKVVVTCRDSGDEWTIGVADNGIGIAAEDQPRLFQVFQRLVTHEQYQGTGIGLAACRKIVEHHSGRIWVVSEHGTGSTFYFTLPKDKTADLSSSHLG